MLNPFLSCLKFITNLRFQIFSTLLIKLYKYDTFPKLVSKGFYVNIRFDKQRDYKQ